MEKIFIAGCGGMLGDSIYKVFKDDYILKCTSRTKTDSYIEELDFTNFGEYERQVTEFKPDYLFHIGSATDLEWCDKYPDKALVINTASVRAAVMIANKLNIPIIYISTASVFNGYKEGYYDNDETSAVSTYGITKSIGEKIVSENANKYIIIRSGWMVGGGPKKDKKFVWKIIDQIQYGRKQIFAVSDMYGTITYAYDFCKTLKNLIEYNCWNKTFNCTCRGICSRYDIAKEIVNVLGVNVEVVPVTSNYFSNTTYRGKNEVLICKGIEDLGLSEMRGWKASLKEYLEKEYKDKI